MPTERGTKLLTSGWWGRSRHPNYMCVQWCRHRHPCIDASLLPQGRLVDGLRLVTSHWLQHAHHVLLRHVLCRPAHPSREARRRSLREEVRIFVRSLKALP